MLEADLTGKRILLAEDIDLNWEVASEILSITGVELHRAVNGRECLEMFENSEIGYYDAVIQSDSFPNLPYRLDTIHTRHFPVYQDKLIIVIPFMPFFDHLDCLHTILRPFGMGTEFFQIIHGAFTQITNRKADGSMYTCIRCSWTERVMSI